MKNRVFVKYLSKDIVFGLASNRIKYFLSFLLFGYLSYDFYKFTTEFIGVKIKTPTITDFWFCFFQGIVVYDPSSGLPFKIPFNWIIIQILMSLLVINYPICDLYTTGIQTLTRIKKRSYWWLSKCIWNFMTVLSMYSIAFLCACVFSSIFGDFTMSFTNELFELQTSEEFDLLRTIVLYLLPVLTSMAISMVQMLISIIFKPIYGFIIIMCYIIISSYYCSPFFIGNYSMLLRNAIFDIGQIRSSTAIIINVLIIIASASIGLFHFRHVDIIKKG